MSGRFKRVKGYVGTAHVMATIEETQAEPEPASGKEASIMNNRETHQKTFNGLVDYFPFGEFPWLKLGVLSGTIVTSASNFGRELANAYN